MPWSGSLLILDTLGAIWQKVLPRPAFEGPQGPAELVVLALCPQISFVHLYPLLDWPFLRTGALVLICSMNLFNSVYIQVRYSARCWVLTGEQDQGRAPEPPVGAVGLALAQEMPFSGKRGWECL